MENTVNILFIGDVVSDAGMGALRQFLPKLIEQYQADCVIVNGENICDGKGLTGKEADEIFALGAHVITTGNHVWENWKSRPLLAENKFVLRPHNYPRENPGRGYATVTLPDGLKVGVIQLQGRVYMSPIDCPFKIADFLVQKIRAETSLIFVDFHAEATAEKIALGWHLDGLVTAICGTHTHVQTADARILPKGTAFITDVGMTGAYDSVVGMRKDVAIKRFILQTAHKYENATGDARIAGVCVRANADNGQAVSIENFMVPEMKKSI